MLLDDTLTQGGTLAALAAYIENAGGKVAGMVTWTGKPYSAKIKLPHPTLTKLRERYGDIESTFRAATGHGFDGLTESEARYLTGFRQTDVNRDRIAAAGDAARQRDAARAPEQQELSDPDALDFSRAGLAAQLAGAANSIEALRLPAGYLVGDLFY